jgi:glycosyltransferase involved in cell wall biosynthesis
MINRTDVSSLPLVSIVTPVYNGEKYLRECVESVLAQSYQNWEYTIVDNCSTDRTLEIAERYAIVDKRIRVYHYEEFVDVIQSHNRALRLICPDCKYCKVVSADDWLFPECIARMVELAEANPSVGIVVSYQLRGGGNEWYVRDDELPYPSTVVPGKEICRLHLLTNVYVFGNPTSTLYRSDLIKGTDCFYPISASSRAEADASACFKYLKHTDFGFVHQVLSYERVHEVRISTTSKDIHAYLPNKIEDLLEYGPFYLTKDELGMRLKELMDEYYEFLAICAVNFRGRNFWNYHKMRLEKLGYQLGIMRLAKEVCLKLADLLFNPKQTVEKVLRRLNLADVGGKKSKNY